METGLVTRFVQVGVTALKQSFVTMICLCVGVLAKVKSINICGDSCVF